MSERRERRGTRIGAYACGLLLAAALPAAAAVQVKILAPAAQQPVFGQVVFEAQVAGNEAIVRVEFLIDGKSVGVVRRPPYRVVADVGDDNREREFRAVAYGAGGASATDRVVTLPVRIDEQMNVRLQQLFITVMLRGARTLDLQPEDFRVLDNGQEQKIVTFDKGELPITAVLLLDSSESMRGELLAAAESGARAFVAGMRPLDQAMLALFSDQLLRVTDFTADHAALEQALSSYRGREGLSITEAVPSLEDVFIQIQEETIGSAA